MESSEKKCLGVTWEPGHPTSLSAKAKAALDNHCGNLLAGQPAHGWTSLVGSCFVTLQFHQLFQYSIGKRLQKTSPPGFPGASRNALLLSVIVMPPFTLSFVLSTLPEFTMDSHPLPEIYTTSVDSNFLGYPLFHSIYSVAHCVEKLIQPT